MSLTYHSEHLAWQQRLAQEKSRANTFYKTTSSFYTSTSPVCRSPFPSANQDSIPINYKTMSYNLGFTFGGTKNIKYAKRDSPQNLAEKLRHQIKDSRPADQTHKKQQKNPLKVNKRYLKQYANELRLKIKEEHEKRLNLEHKLKNLR